MVLDKTPTTREDESRGVLLGLAQLAEHFELSLPDFCAQLEIVVHGTTTGDNTMIEMNGSPTGLLVTEGHRDEIEMRRVHKESIWDPTYPPPPPIARRRARIPIPQRMNHLGEVVLPLDEDAVRRGVRRLRALGVRSIAVVYIPRMIPNGTVSALRLSFLSRYSLLAPSSFTLNTTTPDSSQGRHRRVKWLKIGHRLWGPLRFWKVNEQGV